MSAAAVLPSPRIVSPLHPALQIALAAMTALGGSGSAHAHHHPARIVVRDANELGRIPILEYHMVGDSDARWTVAREHFRKQLALLYERGYRPITVAELVDRKIVLPAGLSPVVFTFDDASPSQFSFVERDGKLEVDPNSAVGIWLDFHRTHPDWANKATFCVLPGAAAGHAFFGDRGIDGQLTTWRFRKVRFLVQHGFELCDHTLWHADLAKYSDEIVQEQIARGALAIDSAVPGYRVRTFALPLGIWPRNRDLARAGLWRDPSTGHVIRYRFDAILQVSGGPCRSPFDPKFDPFHLPRVEIFGNALERLLDELDRSGSRYVAGRLRKDRHDVAGGSLVLPAARYGGSLTGRKASVSRTHQPAT